MRKKINLTDCMPEELLNISVHLQKIWRNSAIIWTIMDYAFTILSFMTSVIVIFLQTSNISNSLITLYTIIFTSISSTFVVVSFCINPRKHKMVYRQAFNNINAAVMATYLTNDKEVYENLAKSIVISEKIIATSYEVEICSNNENFRTNLHNVEK